MHPPSNPCRSVRCDWVFSDLFNFNQTQNNGAVPTLGPLAIDTVVPAEDWQEKWRENEAERREKSPWAAGQEVA